MQDRSPAEATLTRTANGASPTDTPDNGHDLLTPGEVARLFGVDPKTVTRWAAAGKLEALRTLGGHRRYRAAEVHRLLDQRSGRPATNGNGNGDGHLSHR